MQKKSDWNSLPREGINIIVRARTRPARAFQLDFFSIWLLTTDSTMFIKVSYVSVCCCCWPSCRPSDLYTYYRF